MIWSAIWYLTGLFLILMFVGLAAAIVAAGELRGGLEMWNDAVWQTFTFGRWNAPTEEDGA